MKVPLRRLRAGLLGLGLVGCQPIEYDPVFGYGGDNDGDGWADFEEEEAGSDPNDRFDWDFGSGQWPDFTDEAVRAGVIGTGWGAGETAPDFLSVDQYGNRVPFYTFYGYVVILELKAGWCDPCRDEAPLSRATWRNHRLDGVLVIHQLVDDDDGMDGLFAVDYQQSWADEYQADFPVVHDSQSHAMSGVAQALGWADTWTFPTTVVLDHEFRVVETFVGGGQHAAAEELALELARLRDL